MQAHKEIKQKEGGNIYFIGDVHGDMELVQKSLESVNFDFEQDTLISVGDLIDRGPESLNCLRLLNEPWFHAVQGNHESLLIDNYETTNESSLRHWCERNGGQWWLDITDSERNEAYQIVKDMPLALTVHLRAGDKVGVTHAEPLDGNWTNFIALLERRDKTAVWLSLWSRVNIKENLHITCNEVDSVVVGHTPVSIPKALGNVVYLDTGIHSNKFDDAPLPILEAADVLALTRAHREKYNVMELELHDHDVHVFELSQDKEEDWGFNELTR